MNIPYKVTPIFEGDTITIPYQEPIILKGKREDGNFVFKYNYQGENYYIFTTYLEGVINNNLPEDLDKEFKDQLIETVNQYCECCRQGLPQNVFEVYLKRRMTSINTRNMNSSNLNKRPDA
jgi:hypothetical protein